MDLPLLTPGSKAAQTAINLADVIATAEYKPDLVHQVVNAFLSGGRAGTKAQKTRREVRGGGAKPWRQKGTGRARAGSSRSPIWRGGGVTFAARPRNHAVKLNQKMYRGAMRCIVAELIRQGRLAVIDGVLTERPRTKDLVQRLKGLALVGTTLIITDAVDDNLRLAARNIPHVSVVEARSVDPVSLIGYASVLLTQAAVKQIEERLL